MGWSEKAQDWLWHELAEMKQVRLVMVALVLIALAAGVFAGWWGAKEFNAERFSTMEQRLANLQQQLDSAKSAAPPVAPTPSGASSRPVDAPQADTHPQAPKSPGPPRGREPKAVAQTPPPPTQTTTAPNGIAIGGGIVTNATVNNFAPPPWLLDQGAVADLTSLVRSHKQTGGSELVMVSLGDPDSARLADQIVGAFREGGWELGGIGYSQGVFMPALEGVRAVVHSEESVPQMLKGIAQILVRTGVVHGPIDVLIDPKIPQGTFQLRIGRRPIDRPK